MMTLLLNCDLRLSRTKGEQRSESPRGNAGWRSALCVALAVGLVACSNDISDLEQYVQSVKARKSSQIEPIPQIKPYQAFVFAAAGRRDPFLPAAPNSKQSNSDLRPDPNRNREPLEEFPLDGLQMQGAITFAGHIYGLVKAPDGVVHRVSVGNHMGQNYGKITQVSDSEISLTEIVPDGFGGWMERPATLVLAK